MAETAGDPPVRPDAEARIAALGIWSGPIEIDVLPGGLSNESYRVGDHTGRYVVRFGRDYPFHHVDRAREALAARAAHAAGLAPEVVHSAPGTMVSRFIDGRALDAAGVRADPARIAALLRQFHDRVAEHVSGAAHMFWPFHVVRDYARTLAADGSRHAGSLDGFLATARELEAQQIAMPIVFAHNDLLPANFIDDGTRLWLIDFEYAGFSTAMFDLAGTSANAVFSADGSDALLDAYLGGRADPALRRALSAMQCAALLREAMWSMVSEIHLDTPGVDFTAYTAENLVRLGDALDAHRTRFGKA